MNSGIDVERRFTNQNWRGVLKEIADYAPNKYGRGKSNYGDDHPLVKRLKIEPYELMLIMGFLNDQGLIEYDKSEGNWVSLTSKGFDVSQQNQNQRVTFRSNFVTVLFTSIIAFTGVVSLINAGLRWESWIGLFAFICGLAYIIREAKKKNIL